MGTPRVLESSFIDITNTAILILEVIHNKVLNGFISAEGWANTPQTHQVPVKPGALRTCRQCMATGVGLCIVSVCKTLLWSQ